MQISGRNSPDVNERTSLLGAYGGQNNGTITPDEGDEDIYGRDIDPNEFDIILSRSESYTTGLGIEPESQESAMLRGPRRYSGVKPGRKPSLASLQRKASRSTIGSDQSPIEEVDEEEESKSPFLAGVSVGRFWLIFGGILACYFVACFDSTMWVFFERLRSRSNTNFNLPQHGFKPSSYHLVLPLLE